MKLNNDENDYIPNGYARVTEVLEPFTKLHTIDQTPLLMLEPWNPSTYVLRNARSQSFCR